MIHRIDDTIPMKDLPTWLQELWELDSSLARRAEKHYLELNAVKNNVDLPVVVGSATMYKAVFSFKKSQSSGGFGKWVQEIELFEAKNEAELKDKIAAYANNDHCGYHEHIKLISINPM